MNKKPTTSANISELRRRAEARLGEPQSAKKSDRSAQRLLQELEVHQIELQMQNAELQKARDALEVALENYTDLYDFAPVGYFSVDESGVILEANLTGAALLGVERSRLINQRLLLFLPQASRPAFSAFLEQAFTKPQGQTCEALVVKEGIGPFWTEFRAVSAIFLKGTRKWCRVTFGDISDRKQAEEAQRRTEVLTVTNRELRREIVGRQSAEEALKESEQDQARLLEESRHMQEQLRFLSHQLLLAQEEERKRISRELHDVVAQTLTGINVRLATLKKEAALDTKDLERNITRTQRLVVRSVRIVHRFARELRPAMLDDLGLIPALHAFTKHFTEETNLRVTLSADEAVEPVADDKRTVLYRVAQEALTNIARHAQASRANVEIRKLDDGICMTIKDDGKGFETEQVLHGKKKNRLGLLGMRERVEMVRGNFTVQSARGEGTTVRVQIPISGSENARQSAILESVLSCDCPMTRERTSRSVSVPKGFANTPLNP